MALPDLLRRLEEEAAARAAGVLDAARSKAALIAGESSTRLAERRAIELASREVALRTEASREAAAARREAAARVLAARDEALQRVHRRMEELLHERRGTEAVLARAAADLDVALGYLAAGSVRCRPELGPWAQARIPAGASFTVQPDLEVGTGAVLLAPDGSVEIDATVEQRLARWRRELAVTAASMLEGRNGAGVG
jgi:vacuolar-type H+-ATPase subunit E/Vma4